MSRKRTTWIAIAAASLVGATTLLFFHPDGRVALAFLGLPDIKERLQRTTFDSTAWNDEARAYRDHVRIRMVDDLLKRHPLIGKRRAEVVALLGEPKPTAYFREYALVYWLGPERSWVSIDSEWLCVKLDSSGRVSECRVLRD